MATTTNFGWDTPDDTDLVKDGALAIRTLGSSIDTSFVDLKGGTTGQVLSKASNTDLDYTWVTTDDANAIQNAIVDAKGDLIAASAADTPARLAVGNNGETLVADSAATTGLRWQGNYAAGKNVIINGDFRINQRSFSSTTTSEVFGFDRFFGVFTDGTSTYSSQTFTPGAAPVSGYEGSTYARLVSTGQTATNARTLLRHNVESVRTLAGNQVTISFWAQAGSGTPKIAVELQQNYGSGGSPSSAVNYYLGQVTLSTSWTRYSLTYTLPSLSGKTLGTTNDGFLQVSLYVSAGSDWNSRTGSLGIQSNTFNLWGLQLEAGSVATAFQTATGTLQGELAACQRYYQLIASGNTKNICNVAAYNATSVYGTYFTKVSMRTAPTISVVTGTDYYSVAGNNGSDGSTTVGLALASENQVRLEITSGIAVTQGYAYWIDTTNASAFLAVQAEL